MTVSVAVAARAALAGNPSDGFGGAVVAIPIRTWSATATLDDVDQPGPAGVQVVGTGSELGLAALEVLRRDFNVDLPDAIVTLTTTIPRSVGLAGSSALAIACLRAIGLRCSMSDKYQAAARLLSDPDALAVIALNAENDVLGIAAGLQDRLVQAYDRPLLMEFGAGMGRSIANRRCGRVTPVPESPWPLVIAWRPDASQPSTHVHGPLRDRRDDPDVQHAMIQLADCARRAAVALRDTDREALAHAMNETWRWRTELVGVDPAHAQMADVLRELGAAVNSTGSGGAVVALAHDDDDAQQLCSEVSQIPGVHARRRDGIVS